MYSIQELSKLAGVSTRTLRYYDEIGLLRPARSSSSGYRLYGTQEVDQLQMILFYRALDFELRAIARILKEPDFNQMRALYDQKDKLEKKRQQLSELIGVIDLTIASREGGANMTDTEKFKAFKKGWVDENHEKYGEEVTKRYGVDAVKASNDKLMGLSEEQFKAQETLQEAFFQILMEAFREGSPSGELGQKAAAMHKEWLSYFWPEYTPEAHYGLATLYVEDNRFRAYYDDRQKGLAEFLKEAIRRFTGQ